MGRLVVQPFSVSWGLERLLALAGYLRSHGFCLEVTLCPGAQQSASETEVNLERVIPMAQRLSAAGPKAPILARLGLGCHSLPAHGGIGLQPRGQHAHIGDAWIPLDQPVH